MGEQEEAARRAASADCRQTYQQSIDTHGEIVKRGRESPLHVISLQNQNTILILLLKLSALCRQLEPPANGSLREALFDASIFFAAKRHVWQRMNFLFIRTVLIAMIIQHGCFAEP